MSSRGGNPFLNNTPSSSPAKQQQLNGKRISKSTTSATTSTQSSPVRRPNSSANVKYTDRFIPKRTELDLNAVFSIGSSKLLKPESADTEGHFELQKEREAHRTFDTVLKNELFGEQLNMDSSGYGDSIEKIQWATSSNPEEPSTPTRSHGFLSDNESPRHDSDLNKANATRKGLGTRIENVRGASLLTYREKTATRPTRAFIIQNQYSTSSSPIRSDSERLLLSPRKKIRQIAKVPYRVLDAPSLADDFYYDLIDWSSTDVLGVALGKSIFLTDNNTNEVVQLADTTDEFTSLNWVGAGSHLAAGRGNGIVEIYDIVKRKCIRTMPGHADRVACLSWNNHILSSGSRDRKILHRDVRMPDPYFEEIRSHTQEVCGLKWNAEENKLASGGNDNQVYVYDGFSKRPFLNLSEHTAAVKALAWSPHRRGILASGGGTADRKLKIWNVSTSNKINDVDTSSQVCNMVWSKNTDEIVTSHGYSKYNLTIWEASKLEPVAILKGHSFRVLHLTLSSDGTTIVSGAGDETLRYWKIFEKQTLKRPSSSTLLNAFNQLR
ncbi:LAMI_0D05996g1_1 [Lachancea mirantina]|uniref:LAMI_0D05996g1_1 n=1 Tax=Lachancea mirantina TaxID=1230905 RepID=A0A1G4JBE9_9SACH|nr:LAMI_0D05996g1_1 [Lachancea mirantina]